LTIGKRVAFSTGNLDDQHQSLSLDIRVVDLLLDSETIVFEVQSKLGGYITDITWSPDQEKLAFVMEKEEPSGQGELYLLDITNGELNQLTEG
jgi:Tol biopolymer transport system component